MTAAFMRRAAEARLFRAACAWTLACAALVACGGGASNAPSPTSPGTPTPDSPTSTAEPTAIGTPTGPSVSATIGPAGGTLASADGRLLLEVPAGAFAQPTTVAIEPITNNAHGAKGPAYRISPEGLHTPVPMTLTFQADATVLNGTALQSLTIATQDAQGRWHAKRSPVRDATDRSVQVSTTHFSDWAVIAGAQLRPATADVMVGAQQELTLIVCDQQADTDDDSATVRTCHEPALSTGELENWSVNGIAGGNAGVGTITPRPRPGPISDPTRALFVAPAAIPGTNPVAVSVHFDELTSGAVPLTLVANLTIVDVASCAWLREVPTLSFNIAMAYQFQGSGPLGQLSLQQQGRMNGELQSIDQNGLFGTWRGLTTQGSAELNDQHTFGDRTTLLAGNGTPAIGQGIDDNQISGAVLVVDYTHCTYSLTAQIAVLSASGEPGDEPRPHNVGSFTRGDVPIGSGSTLRGSQAMPPRLQPDAAGTYAPGGLGVGLVADGYATDTSSGHADIEWQLQQKTP